MRMSNKRTAYIVTLSVLLLGVATVASGLILSGSFASGEPSFDQGCYCHNGNISVYVNGTGDGLGGKSFGPIATGSTFHLLVSTGDQHATGVVPGLQEWMSNQTDNAKFTISPTQVTAGSAQDMNKTNSGNITALYAITAPSTAGTYVLTIYAQGSFMQPISIQVTGGTTTQAVTVTVTATATATLPATTVTTTTTTTLPATTVTTTLSASTVVSTETQTVTSTVTQASSSVSDWAYGAMVVPLLVGLAIGYVIKRPGTKPS